MEQIVKFIRGKMPEELREGWKQMHLANGARDTWEVREASLWVATHGPAMGFRPPNVRERARITGASAYWESLDLDLLELYNAQGNHFDRH
eukprot:632474-Lingulodinium_polyedra.AAC.1